MKKYVLVLALILGSILSHGQTWLPVGNTLQRAADGTGFKYRFSLGSPGFYNISDSIRNALMFAPNLSLSDSSSRAVNSKFIKQLLAGSSLTFSNGLTKTLNNVSLGGIYSGNVVIGEDTSGNYIVPTIGLYPSTPSFPTRGGLNFASEWSGGKGVNVDLFNNGGWRIMGWKTPVGDTKLLSGDIEFNEASGQLIINNDYGNAKSSLSKGIKLKRDYSTGWGVADSLFLAPKSYVDRAFGSIDLSDYVTKTGTETLTNKTLAAPVINTPDITNGTANSLSLVNGSINSTPIGASSPNVGTFTTLTANVAANVPNLATTDNSGNAANTKFVQDRLATGQTIGANTTGSADKWGVIDAPGSGLSNPTYVVGIDGAGTSAGYTTIPNLKTALNLNDGSNLNNNASSATLWGGQPADFSSAIGTPFSFMGFNTGGTATQFSTSGAKSLLATSFQDVTSVGSTTLDNVNFNRTDNTTSAAHRYQTGGVNDWFVGTNPLGDNGSDLDIYSYGLSDVALRIKKSNGNFLIGSTSDDGVNKLQVNGSARIKDKGIFGGTGNEVARFLGVSPFISFYDATNTNRMGYLQHTGADLTMSSDVGKVIIDPELYVTGNITAAGNAKISGDLTSQRLLIPSFTKPASTSPSVTTAYTVNLNGQVGADNIATTGFALAGRGEDIRLRSGNGGASATSAGTKVGGDGGRIDLVAGDAGIAPSGTSGVPGDASLQGGAIPLGAGTPAREAGLVFLKGGTNQITNGYGGSIYLVPGYGSNNIGLGKNLTYDGNTFLGANVNGALRGAVIIGANTSDLTNDFQVTGNSIFNGKANINTTVGGNSAIFNLDDSEVSITHNSSFGSASLYAYDGNVLMNSIDELGASSAIQISPTGGMTVDDGQRSRGLGDIANYDANKQPGDYATKRMVDLKANLSGGNIFTGVQTFSNGSVQPANTYTNSGFLNTLQSNTLTTNVNTYLPADGGVLLNNSATGWAIYSDNVYTSGSPFTITAGSTSNIPNNAGTVINTQIPLGVSALYNAGKITPQNDGDSYIVNVRFTAVSTSNTGLADVSLDVGGALGIIDEQTISLRKGAGNSQRINIVFDVYSGSTFLANGGTLKFHSLDGDTNIYNIQYKVTRTHKAR